MKELVDLQGEDNTRKVWELQGQRQAKKSPRDLNIFFLQRCGFKTHCYLLGRSSNSLRERPEEKLQPDPQQSVLFLLFYSFPAVVLRRM